MANESHRPISPLKHVEQSTFAIVTNGYVDGPAQALRDFLVSSKCRRLTCVYHPLLRDERSEHLITVHEDGELVERRSVRMPSFPPLTFPIDLGVPLRSPDADCWFGFNALACAKGLIARRGRVRPRVVYWCVDFTPERFGTSPLTRIFDRLDRYCCQHADLRVELSEAGLTARNHRHATRRGFSPAPTRVVPMGAWLDRAPIVPTGGFRRRRIVYMGHVAPGKGTELLVESLMELWRRDVAFDADIIGRGPLLDGLKRRVADLGLSTRVTFHGFVEDHAEVERLIAAASIAAAPYEDDPSSFTHFADPGKLRAYLAAGLPIVMTGVPPNATELSAEAGARVSSEATPIAFADALEQALGSEGDWTARRYAALEYSKQFDWPRILTPTLEALGFGSGSHAAGGIG